MIIKQRSVGSVVKARDLYSVGRGFETRFGIAQLYPLIYSTYFKYMNIRKLKKNLPKGKIHSVLEIQKFIIKSK